MKEIQLLSYADKIWTNIDLKNILIDLCVTKGDIIYIHSSLMNLGKIMSDKRFFLDNLLEVFIDSVGEDGTVIMPTYSYSFCKKEDFDIVRTKGTVGLLNEYFRKREDVKRTDHPIFSDAIWGKETDTFLDIGKDAWGSNSVFEKMLERKAKIVTFGEYKGYTFHHFIEEKVGVSHRYFKEFCGNIIYEDNHKENVTVPYYVRNLEKKVYLVIIKFMNFFQVRVWNSHCLFQKA